MVSVDRSHCSTDRAGPSPPSPEADAPELSILVATYRRPRQLDEALGSCLAQDLAGERRLELVVVDNSPGREAAPVVAARAAGSRFPVRYVWVPGPDLARARNAGVAASGGELVAFLDDDEVAARSWLRRMVQVLEEHAADGVLGPVRPVFPPPGPPPWARRAGYFDTRRPLATGAPVSHGGLGNALLLRSRCLCPGEPFSLAFGRCGGEDTELFLRLEAGGRRLVWCADELVEERVEASRVSPSAVAWRAYAAHHGYVRARLSTSGSPVRAALWAFAVGGLRLVVWSLPALGSLVWAGPWMVWGRVRVAGALGRLSWFLPLGAPVYPREPASSP